MLHNRTLRLVFMLLLFVLVVLMGAFLIKRVFFSPPIVSTIQLPNSTSERVIQINVVNATKQIGVAKQVMDYMRKRGFDVIELSNANELQDRSCVLNRTGDSLIANQVAYALGISNQHINTEIDSTMYLDCTILLGNDYSALKPFK